jgi:predicted RNA-binding Zn ribbon-like protein
MLFKNTAAFSGTYISELVASLSKSTEKVEDNMNEEQMKALLAGLLDSFKTELKASVETMESKVDAMSTEVKAEVEKANGEIATLAVSLAETKEELKASKEAPVVVAAAAEPVVQPPSPAVLAAGQTVVGNGDLGDQPKTKKQKIAEVWASEKSMQDKMKDIVKINAEIE